MEPLYRSQTRDRLYWEILKKPQQSLKDSGLQTRIFRPLQLITLCISTCLDDLHTDLFSISTQIENVVLVLGSVLGWSVFSVVAD